MSHRIERRGFITLIGGAAVAWPLMARAQQPAMPVIGFLRSTPAAGFEYLVNALRQGLNDAGFVEGRNVAVEYRWAENQPDRLLGLAADLVSRQVAAIVASGTETAQAAKAAATTTPIYSSSEPIRSEPAWSRASTGRVATPRVSSLPLLTWRPSCLGYCTSWYPRLPSSPCCATRIFLNPRSSPEAWRKRGVLSGGKS